MKSPFHHIKHAPKLFDHFHRNLHQAFAVFVLAMIGMLRGVSHILTPTSASRQWGGFITSDFWDQNPTEENIRYALYGDGNTGATAYTRTWRTSCIPTNVQPLSTLNGLTGAANTIYVINSGTYTLTYPITLSTCSALIGNGDVYLKPASGSVIPVSIGQSNVIVDNIKINGNNQTYTGMTIGHLNSVTLNNIDIYQSLGQGLYTINQMDNVTLNNSRIYNNSNGILLQATISFGDPYSYITINNSHIYNNTVGIHAYRYTTENMAINNSQIYNNGNGIIFGDSNPCSLPPPCLGCTQTRNYNNSINNSTIYNNGYGIYTYGCYLRDNGSTTAYTYTYNLNNTKIYNNTHGVRAANGTPNMPYYGTLKFFSNTNNTGGTDILIRGSGSPIRNDGTLDETTTTINYDHITNPQNGTGSWLLSGNLPSLRGIRPFNALLKPIRYVFGLNIPKQEIPVWYDNSIPTTYGNNGSDYFTTRYIAEPESTLSIADQAIVNQYFGSGSIYTQNRATNGCSLSAFQVKTLNPGIFNNTNNKFEDHTIYILSGTEYTSTATGNAFVFNGNCIALVGSDDTIFTKWNANNSLLYANNKRNIIIDNVKVDGTQIVFGATMIPNNTVATSIKFDGNTNNNTINDVQVYNNAAYGIYLGLGSHHNTLMNIQSFNNNVAGIHLYYASNYNVINNTQTYNNGQYGIRFANGSSRNTMNNFQAYNNSIGLFGDLTTQENILNRAVIYNNSEVGIDFKNSSGNILNDVRVYNNMVGIRALYSSPGNKYYGELKMFANASGNFEGTSGNDASFAPGSSPLFSLPGTLNTGGTMSCLYATNPTLPGQTLLYNDCSNTGHDINGFTSAENRNVNYAFGLNIYKQAMPKRYETGGTLTSIPSQYDATKYIAEVFAIRDNHPEGVYFTSTGTAELDTRYSTNIYTAGVLNISVPIQLTLTPSTASGVLIISGTAVGTTGTVTNGDIIQIKVLSATGHNQTITGSVTIGTVNTGFTVTTRDLNQLPNTFAFMNLTSVPLSIFTGSAITVSGLETGVLASINFTPSTTSGRLEVYSGAAFMGSGTTGVFVRNGYQVQVIAQSSSGYGQTITGNVTIGLGTGAFTIITKGSDTTPPTTPTLTYPLNEEELFFVTFERTASTDTGAGIAGYIYEIAEDSNFLDIINTGFMATTTTGVSGSPNTSFDETSGIYYRRIRAKDRDDNVSSRSNTGKFEAVDFNGWEFSDTQNANLRTYYESDVLSLKGIKPGLSIRARTDNNGSIYKGDNDKGTGVYVQNDDEIYLSVRSSNNYDRTVSSTLTIANRTLEFNVITKDQSDNGCTLSDDDTTAIQTIFDSLVSNYSGDENRYDEFLFTMQSMLEDEIDFTNDCNLEYLQDLIEDELGIVPGAGGSVNTGAHIAPNCKEYSITYDSVGASYTSPNLTIATAFANRDSLTRYIDSKNPGDCHINTYGASSRTFTNTDSNKHIAPNGKIYTISLESGKYTSNGFVYKKYFNSVAELRTYIDKNNSPSEIWSHQVDTNFTPQTYTAPNAKEYKIYKTNRGYMSYKLMKVRYFSTLSEIQSYINRNNPR